jgi:hypothetical protein
MHLMQKYLSPIPAHGTSAGERSAQTPVNNGNNPGPLDPNPPRITACS